MITYCRPYRRYYLVASAALLVVNALDTFLPQVIRWAIDHLIAATSMESEGPPAGPLGALVPADWFGAGAFMGGMWIYGALYALIVAVMGVFRYFMSINFARGAVHLTDRLRQRFFAHLQRLPAAWHDHRRSGDLMTIATSDLNALREFYWIGFMLSLDTAIYFVLVPVYMAGISVKLLLACLVALPLIPLIVARLASRMEKRYDESQAQLSLLSERTRESLAGIRVVKSFAREDGEIRTFARSAREYCRRAIRLAAIEALEQPLLVFLIALADLIVVIYGGALVLDGLAIQRTLAAQGADAATIEAAVSAAGAITVGGFVAFFSYLIRLSGPMIGFGWVVSIYLRSRVSLERFEEVLRTPPVPTETGHPATPGEARGAIEVRNLTFAYDQPDPAGRNDPNRVRRPALRDISFRAAPGSTVALVGPVGSGKSTLLSLIPRLYEPPPGTVRLDGRDVRTIPPDELRAGIGSVPQETFLFSDTIQENIALGIPGGRADARAHADWLEECARLAEIEPDILRFPKRYDTLLGEKGVNLSGGQKQRLAIARALARRPAVLLLDDCLSAVDTETESRILAGLRRISGRCTVLVASHRLSTVEHADEILVLGEGRIVERGTHAALVAAGGTYADLWKKQQLERELEDEDSPGQPFPTPDIT